MTELILVIPIEPPSGNHYKTYRQVCGHVSWYLLEALRAYQALDAQRMTCEECEDCLERSPETCGYCCPFALRARDLMNAALARVDRS